MHSLTISSALMGRPALNRGTFCFSCGHPCTCYYINRFPCAACSFTPNAHEQPPGDPMRRYLLVGHPVTSTHVPPKPHSFAIGADRPRRLAMWEDTIALQGACTSYRLWQRASSSLKTSSIVLCGQPLIASDAYSVVT